MKFRHLRMKPTMSNCVSSNCSAATRRMRRERRLAAFEALDKQQRSVLLNAFQDQAQPINVGYERARGRQRGARRR